jgi:hypothetical protein
MLDDPMLDPMGALVAELRADPDVAALVGDRVRGGEPKGASATYEGDALGPGDYKAFVVLVALDDPPWLRVPVQRAIYAFNCFAATYQQARTLYGAVVKALHYAGPRLKGNGLGIYLIVIETGGEQDSDPDTRQPLIRGTIRVTATAQAIA